MLQFFILILNLLIKNLNDVLLALGAVFGDSEKDMCCQLCEVQSSKKSGLISEF